jgi:Xaa-Pro dipeptidase
MTPPMQRGLEAAFPKDEFDRRLAAARAAIGRLEIGTLIVTGPENIYYLTGQQTPGYYTFQALLLPADGEPCFIVRRLEAMNCMVNSYIDRVEVYDDGTDPFALLSDLLAQRKVTRIAIDKRGWFLPIAAYESLQVRLGDLADGAGVIESLRAIKSPAEIERIERAAAYVDNGMRAGYRAIGKGSSENDLVAAMMGEAIRSGSEYLGMEPLVSTGRRTGIPHGTWRRRKIEPGDPIFLEMAACHDRYHAVLMRSAWMGPPPDYAKRMMDTCQDALTAALDKLRPGNLCEDVHNAAQAVIDRAGFTENYRKRTGYSIGISFAPDWGEWQVLSLFSGVREILRPGMVFHIPPALRRYGEFTVGVSETAVVTEDRCRVLGSVPRDLQIY